MENKWYIYCSQNEFRLNEITLDVALAALKKPGQPAFDFWFAWREGMTDWLKVLEIPEFRSLMKKGPPPLPGKVPPPPPKAVLHSAETSKQIQKQTLTEVPKQTDWSEKRQHPRHIIKMKVIVTCKGKTFRCFTKDISMGGINLENSLPEDMIGVACEVYISSADGKRSIKFDCIAAGDGKKTSRISFKSSEFAEELNQWIMAEVKQNKKSA